VELAAWNPDGSPTSAADPIGWLTTAVADLLRTWLA